MKCAAAALTMWWQAWLRVGGLSGWRWVSDTLSPRTQAPRNCCSLQQWLSNRQDGTRFACRFALSADPNKEPIAFPRCSFVDCAFNATAELVCPFAAGGRFVETDSPECPDFMKASRL